MAEKRTYVKRVIVGRPVKSINEAASGVVVGTGRQVGDILVNKSSTNLYEPGTLQGGHMIVTSHNTTTNDLNIAIDSSELNTFIDSALSDRIGGPFVDSAYVEQNSLDSERGLNVFNTELGQLRFSIIPQTDSAIDLGSSTKKFRKLFLSGNTIKLGTLNLSDSGGNFVVRDSDNNNTKLDLSANSTNDLTESDNLYYTRARFDSALGDTTSRGTIRGYINLVDAGGDGSLTYDSAGGKITYTGPSAAEVRAHLNGGHGIVYSTSTGNISVDSSEVRGLFSAGGDLSYNAGTGQFSFDVESVYTQANFESDLSLSLNATNGIAYDSARHKLSLINTGVDSATYGSATRVPILTINAQGRVDSAGSVLVAGVTGFSLDSASGNLTITTADGGSFQAPIHSRDSAELFEISGSSLNYDSGSVNQFTATNITADSAVITDISGTTANYPTIITSQLSADSASILTIDNNVLRTNNLNADSAVITDVSGTTVNFVSGNIGQFDADSARATNFTAATSTLDSARAINISGTGLNYTTAHLANISSDSAKIGNMTITGDLTVSGTQTTINTQTVKVHDPIIHLADSNELSDIVDLGFIGKYYRDGQQRHTGLVRDASNEQYYLFKDVVDSALDSSLTINRSATGFAKADINLANLLADSATLTNITADSAAITDISGVTLNYNLVHAKTATLDSATLTNITADSAVITDISGTTANYPTIITSQLSADSGSITIIDNNVLRTNDLNADSAVITDISGTTANYPTIITSQLSADSGSITTIDNNVLRTNSLSADSGVIVDISGTTLNYVSGNIGQFDVDSGYVRILGGKVAHINGVSGDSANFTTIKIAGEVVNNAMFTDSAYVLGRIEALSLDSERAINLIRNDNLFVDSAYIEQNSLDSERTIALIDSDYVNLRSFDLVRDQFKYTLVDAGTAAGPTIIYDRNSSSPADSDALATIEFRGRNTADSAIPYAQIKSFITDASADSEDGELQFHLKQIGAIREKFALTSRGFELGTNEKLYFQSDSGDLYLHNASTGSHNLLLPDSSGTLLTRDFVTNIIDSDYIGARQSATGLKFDFDDSAGVTKVQITITQAPTIATGSVIGFGNTITLLDKDSAEVTISL